VAVSGMSDCAAVSNFWVIVMDALRDNPSGAGPIESETSPRDRSSAPVLPRGNPINILAARDLELHFCFIYRSVSFSIENGK
jgi:hypothetical protein